MIPTIGFLHSQQNNDKIMLLEWSFVRNATFAKQYDSSKLSERKNLAQNLHLDHRN